MIKEPETTNRRQLFQRDMHIQFAMQSLMHL